MTIEVRTIRDDELPVYVDALATAFLERPDVDKVAAELRELWDQRRSWAAYDGSRICGTFRSWATELTTPGGGCLPAAAVSAVTVLPTHRRRGILRSMVAAEHGAARERGEAVALLYASEYPIYGRFGYGSGTRSATWTLDTLRTGFHGERAGRVELAALDTTTRDAIRDVYETARSARVGEIRRRDYRWDYDLGLRTSAWDPQWKGYVALHRAPSGAIDGFARYRSEEKWEQRQPRYTIKVDDLHALSDDAYAGLWQFLAAIDWVEHVSAERRSVGERLPWLLTNGRAAEPSDVGDALWVRLLDLPRSLEARRYEREARIVLEVVDPDAPGGSSRVELDAGDGGARCRATTRSADLTLHVAAVGAAYLGGTRLRDAIVAHGADEHRDGALAEADRLFASGDEPWCSTFF